MPAPKFSVRHDNHGTRTGALSWTGEVQALAHVTASSAAVAITVPGRDFTLVATTACFVVFGNAGVAEAHASDPNRCFYIPANVYIDVYVPDGFDSTADGRGTLYVRTIRSTADGNLHIAQSHPVVGTSTERGPTTSTTTTTTTTTTSSTTTT